MSCEESAGLCQVSRHESKANHVNGLGLHYMAAIIPISWANWSRWMRRRCVSERRWLYGYHDLRNREAASVN